MQKEMCLYLKNPCLEAKLRVKSKISLDFCKSQVSESCNGNKMYFMSIGDSVGL